MRLFALIFVAMATTALCADFSQCDEMWEISHHTTDRYTDLGGGFVRRAWLGDGVRGIHNSIVVESCAAGSSAEFRLSEAREGLEKIVMAEQRLDALAASGNDFNIGLIVEILQPMSLYEANRRDHIDWESCACAVAYPELRGDKRPYLGNSE